MNFEMSTNYLIKRDGRYSIRRKIPQDLREHYGRTEIVRALGTSNPDEAKRRVREEAVKLDREFDAIRARLTPLPPRLRTYHAREYVHDPEAGEDIWTGKTAPATVNIAPGGFEMPHPDDIADDDSDEDTSDPDDIPKLPSAAEARKVKHARLFNVQLDVAKAMEAARAVQRPAPRAQAVPPQVYKPQTASAGVRLTAVVEAWAKERRPDKRTVGIADRVVKRFYEHVGHVPVRDVTRAHVLQFKNTLLESGQTPANTNNQLTMLGTLLRFATDNLWADSNAAQGIRVMVRRNGEVPRLPFDLPALQAIFSSPVYAEALRPDGGAGEAAYWLPLLALFTGARVEELCQLRPEDIYEEVYRDIEGSEQRCWVLRITNEGEGQGVKNAGSVRRFPIHAELLARGFVGYAHAHKSQPRIFPALKPDTAGAESGNWSKWFGKYLRGACKVTDKRMVFHSFRYLFKDLARDAGVPEDVQDAITGHAGGNRVARGYGGLTYPLAPLVAGMKRIKVVGLSLPQPPNQSR
ncbi:DUF6538 domain-containing protein [Ralstonia pseudosolanacearum]|uniref:site-specific integrase n=1 Tax=Ralstonia pseudosolanacearum TaxID=1310165 RepID=UPI000A908DD6|nr:site-specific integrase [Ralstonia pseudosolanacearum]MDC6292687.1 site-specific integrase [Ralstonia pseudosolanacearum]MDD7788651.1 site-specific integrase [Ralstonia pseudosolanacearum]MDN3368121.1 site-specific integrase [Ralstonia pseudosolanacearum]QOK85741.1 site-specific integrase [Ralstonia pseudosolanacearum]